MTRLLFTLALSFGIPAAAPAGDPKPPDPDPAIDVDGYLRVSKEAAEHRTSIALDRYGHRNVYELAPLLDPPASKPPFESSPVKR